MAERVVVVQAALEPVAAVHGRVQLQFVGRPGAGVGAAGDRVGPVVLGPGGEQGAHAGRAVEELRELVDRQRPLPVGAPGGPRLEDVGEGGVLPAGPVEVGAAQGDRAARGDGRDRRCGRFRAVQREDGPEEPVAEARPAAVVGEEFVEGPAGRERGAFGSVVVRRPQEPGTVQQGQQVGERVLRQPGHRPPHPVAVDGPREGNEQRRHGGVLDVDAEPRAR